MPLDLNKPDDAREFLAILEKGGTLVLDRPSRYVHELSDEGVLTIAQNIFMRSDPIPNSWERQ